MIKRILIVLFSICILSASAQDQTFSSDDDPAFVPGDPDQSTDVPFDDYVPFLVAGVVVYAVWMNRQKKTVQA